MKIVVAGASGFIGTALAADLRAAGHDVRRLVRSDARAADAISWQPEARALAPAALEGIEAIINLAGENIAAGRWTAARRGRILRSRCDATRTLVAALRELPRRPRVLLNASAVGFYGDRGDAVVDETSSAGTGFLADTCRAWEAEARAAEKLGVRTVVLRFGVVLGAEGGALGKMLAVFRLGLGGRLGDGRQWMSWIGRADVVGAIRTVLGDERASGAFNLTAPEPVTNADFTATLARRLRRPAVVAVPRWVLRGAFGAMAEETMLSSTRAVPRRLDDLGYRFAAPTLAGALTLL